MSFKEEFQLAVISRIPIIEVKTSEWFRFCLYLLDEYVKEKPEEIQKDIFIWTPFKGFVPFSLQYDNFEQTDEEIAGTAEDLYNAVKYLLNMKVDRKKMNAIYIFRDLDQFYASDPQDSALIQHLRDLYRKAQRYKMTVIFCNAVGKTIPAELQKEVHSLSMDYPDEKEIKQIFSYVKKELHNFESKTGKKLFKDLNEEEEFKIISAMKGLTADESRHCLTGGIRKYEELSLKLIPYIIEQKQGIVKKSGYLDFYPLEENLDNVGGLFYLKEWLKRRKDCFTKEAREFGLPNPKGLLLVGVQGTGKSLVCKAIGAFYGMPVFRLDVGSLFGAHVGDSESNTRNAIKTAEAGSPAILMIDEIEKSLSGVGSSNYSDGGTTARVFSTLLTWLNDKDKPVFVVATCNNISALPPELLRKGRFDEIFWLDLPSISERVEIFKIHLEKRNRKLNSKHLKEAANCAVNFSGAEIEQVVISAILESFYDGKRPVTLTDIKGEINRTVPLFTTMKDEIESFRKWIRNRARPASKSEVTDQDALNLFND